VIKAVCVVCKNPAVVSTRAPGSAGSGPSSAHHSWQGRAGASAPIPVTPEPADTAPTPSSSAATPTIPVPHTVPVRSASESVVRSLNGSLTVTGVVTDVQPERFESVSTEVSDQLGHLASQLLTLPFRAIGIILAIIFAPLRILLGASLMGMAGRKGSSERIQVPGIPFRVEAGDGSVYQCFLRGEMRGGAIHLGDRVEVKGRLSRRSNVLQVAQVMDVRSGARSHGHVPAGARKLTAKGVAQVALAAFFLLFLLYSCGLGRVVL
jgi:hypothetical protein